MVLFPIMMWLKLLSMMVQIKTLLPLIAKLNFLKMRDKLLLTRNNYGKMDIKNGLKFLDKVLVKYTTHSSI
jgi:hypothetical protein